MPITVARTAVPAHFVQDVQAELAGAPVTFLGRLSGRELAAAYASAGKHATLAKADMANCSGSPFLSFDPSCSSMQACHTSLPSWLTPCRHQLPSLAAASLPEPGPFPCFSCLQTSS